MKIENELKVLLWKTIGGVKLSKSILKEIKRTFGQQTLVSFIRIYSDKEMNVLLAVDLKDEVTYKIFAKELNLDTAKTSVAVEFLLTKEASEIREIWRIRTLEEIVAAIRNEKFSELRYLCRTIWADGEKGDIRMAFMYFLNEMQDIWVPKYLYWGFTVLALFADKVGVNDIPYVSTLAKQKLQDLQVFVEELQAEQKNMVEKVLWS